ncbi:MAG: TlpA family protein disulfide reductase [Armatimonadetes bacterium]|nr:TlpA family protein disulfide reductase [Armatimonadota bacterium]
MGGLLKTVAAFFAAAFSVLAPAPQTQDVKSLEGKPLPAFEMKTIGGQKIGNKTIKGKVAILDFWATWCGPCKAASPFLQDLSKKYDRQLMVIGANAGEETEGPAPAASYAKEHGYTYTFTHSNDDVARKWGVTGFPTFIVVDKSGKVSRVFVGYSEKTKDAVASLVQKLVR